MATDGREQPSEGPLLIVANTYELARHYVREHDLGTERRDWIYVSEPHQARGRRNGRYVRVTIGDASVRALTAQWEIVEILRRNGFQPAL